LVFDHHKQQSGVFLALRFYRRHGCAAVVVPARGQYRKGRGLPLQTFGAKEAFGGEPHWRLAARCSPQRIKLVCFAVEQNEERRIRVASFQNELTWLKELVP
jgi:hypothetical protein